jgi:hypothetical protein
MNSAKFFIFSVGNSIITEPYLRILHQGATIKNDSFTKYKFLQIEKDLSEKQFVAGIH